MSDSLVEDDKNNVIKHMFNERLSSIVENCNDRSDYFTTDRYNQILHEVDEAKHLKSNKLPLTSKQYRRLKRFDIITVSGQEKLIQRVEGMKGDNLRYYCKTEELFDIINTAHIATGHKKTRVMENEITKKYCNINRAAIDIYLSLCQFCQRKKKLKKEGHSLSSPMDSRCQVDLINMQTEPDGEYHYILNYQDHLTKFTILKPLKTESAEKVAHSLIDIFCIFGAPFILQSKNGREFAKRIIENLARMWQGLKLVHGKPKDSQSEDLVERSSEDVKEMLAGWMLINNTKHWSEGLRFVQSKINFAPHEGIGKSPYEVMFGSKPRNGLADSTLEKQVYEKLETEEDLEQLLNKIDKFDNESDDANTDICTVSEDTQFIQTCGKCGLSVFVKCGIKTENQVICNHCSTFESIKDQQEVKVSERNKQQKEVATTHLQKLPSPEIDQNALIKTPGVNQDSLAPTNSLNIVPNMDQIDTKDGILEMVGGSEFTSADSNEIPNGIDHLEVPNTSLNLEMASVLSSESNQRFVSCQCKRYCNSNKCKCRNKKVPCNSQCHRNSACKNK